MRISPTRSRTPSDLPPSEADRSQAGLVADLLAQLIAECDARLAALDTDTVQAARDGALRSARASHARTLEVRRDLEALQTMEHRLIRRFFDPRDPLPALPSK